MSTVIMVRILSALSRHHTEKFVKHSTTNEHRRLSHLSRIHLADTLTTRSRENGSESEGRETPQVQEMTSALDTTVPLQDVSNFSEESTRNCTAQLASTNEPKRTLHIRCRFVVANVVGDAREMALVVSFSKGHPREGGWEKNKGEETLSQWPRGLLDTHITTCRVQIITVVIPSRANQLPS